MEIFLDHDAGHPSLRREETEYSFLEVGFREEELWMLFSAVSWICNTPMEKWDISCEVAGSSTNQREARARLGVEVAT